MKRLALAENPAITSATAGSLASHSGRFPDRTRYRGYLPPVLRGVFSAAYDPRSWPTPLNLISSHINPCEGSLHYCGSNPDTRGKRPAMMKPRNETALRATCGDAELPCAFTPCFAGGNAHDLAAEAAEAACDIRLMRVCTASRADACAPRVGRVRAESGVIFPDDIIRPVRCHIAPTNPPPGNDINAPSMLQKRHQCSIDVVSGSRLGSAAGTKRSTGITRLASPGSLGILT
jgi:hypothetical protein